MKDLDEIVITLADWSIQTVALTLTVCMDQSASVITISSRSFIKEIVLLIHSVKLEQQYVRD